jgi:dolichyl-phosphate beta-glucosyltransferase
MAKKISIVVPIYNEQTRFPKRFNKAYQYFSKHLEQFEMILVNDGSSDQSGQMVKSLAKKYPNIVAIDYKINRGKGYAVKTGVKASKGEFIGFMDADFAVDVKHTLEALELVNQKYDLAIADRNMNQSSVKNNPKLIRRSLGKLLASVNRFGLGLGDITDTQCGFKFFKKRAAKELFLNISTSRWLFDIEVIAMAKRKNYKIARIPVRWDEVQGSKVMIFRDLVPVINDLSKIYYNFLFKKN